MSQEYWPIICLMAVGAIVCTAMVSLSWLLGPKKHTIYKSSPYECGVEPLGEANDRFPIKFYLVAILFVLFDVEVVFLWSWMSVFAKAPLDFKIFSGTEVFLFVLSWVLGYVYVIKVKAIDWDDATSLAPEKLEDTVVKPFTTPIPAPQTTLP